MKKKTLELLRVINIGGGSSNCINNMIDTGLLSPDVCISFNTDYQSFNAAKATHKILFGDGTGAGNNMEKGEQLAKENEDKTIEMLKSHEACIYFVVLCCGGGTGSGAGPAIMQAIKNQYPDSIVMAIVTTPLECEGEYRKMVATNSINKISKISDLFMILNNESILRNDKGEFNENLDIQTAFKLIDLIMSNEIYSVKTAIEKLGFLNVDISDFKAITRNSGNGIIRTILTEPDRLEEDLKKNLSDSMISVYHCEEKEFNQDNGGMPENPGNRRFRDNIQSPDQIDNFVSLSNCNFISRGALVYIEGKAVTTKIVQEILSIVKTYITPGSKIIPGVSTTKVDCMLQKEQAIKMGLSYTPVASSIDRSLDKVLVKRDDLKMYYEKSQKEEKNQKNKYQENDYRSNRDRRPMGRNNMNRNSHMRPNYYNNMPYGPQNMFNNQNNGFNFNNFLHNNQPEKEENNLNGGNLHEVEELLNRNQLRIFVILSNVKILERKYTSSSDQSFLGSGYQIKNKHNMQKNIIQSNNDNLIDFY